VGEGLPEKDELGPQKTGGAIFTKGREIISKGGKKEESYEKKSRS